MPKPPVLTDAQRQAALKKAAEVRKIRSEVKQRLKLGTLTLQEVLEQSDKDEIIAKIKVLSILESLPGVGKVTARRSIKELGIAESRRLSGLGNKQRHALLEVYT